MSARNPRCRKRVRRRTDRAVAALIGAVALGIWLAGCAPAPTPTTVPEPPAEPTATSAPETATPVALDALSITLEPVARGFESPVLVTNAGDGSGRLFVVEQDGRVRVLRDGKVVEGPYIDVSRRISFGGERGLLGMAFSPDFRSSGEFYVNYTDAAGDTVVARFIADDPAADTPVLEGPQVVLKIAQPYSNHNGGNLVFEPGTERLWVGMGDGGSAGDPQGNAQDPDSLLGKMLVLDFGKSATPKAEIVQTGVRNPWRFSFDRATNDLWIGDVGQGAWEEIDVVPLAEAVGVDWGWNLWEGSHPYPEGSDRAPDDTRLPVSEYSHSQGRSVTGGFVYRGSEYPALAGVYLYGDFSSGWLAAIRWRAADGEILAEPEQHVVLPDAGISPSSFGEDEAGELYVCDYGGSVLRVTATAE